MAERFILTLESTVLHTPVVDAEMVNGIHIGKITLRVEPLCKFQSTKTFDALLNSLNQQYHSNEDLRRSITFSLGHNTPNTKNPIAHERAVSAYFTYNPDPKDETVIIEWGTIDPANSEAKLHNFLNKNIDFHERHARGMRISSGHLARLTGQEYVALLDNLAHGKPKSEISSPLRKIINTLYQHNIIPITSDGFVQLPVF